MRYERFVIAFVVLLILFAAVIVYRAFPGHEKPKNYDLKIAALEEKIDVLRREQTAIRVKLDTMERSSNAKSYMPERVIEPKADKAIVENIGADTIATRAQWLKTTKPNVYMVTIKLERLPRIGTLEIATDQGPIPPTAYRMQGDELSVLFQETQEQFIAEGGFISIRYMPED
ncbi:MAG: hypothetical protein PHS37_07790 [Candidatus Omnitrophica bacterium]|nr:hypothetical protein [Candidatus Omnitrophota bacterium]